MGGGEQGGGLRGARGWVEGSKRVGRWKGERGG